MVAAWAAVEKIEQCRRQIFEFFIAQRPDRRPFNLRRRVERRTSYGGVIRAGCARLMRPVLRVTQQQHVIRKNGFPWRKVREPPSYADLIALKNSGIALDRLHERARLTLLGRAALAEASTAQAGAKLVHRLWADRK